MQKIIHTIPSTASFIKQDQDILKSAFFINNFEFKPYKKIITPFVFFIQLLYLLKNSFNTKIYITQFAGYHSFLPSIFSLLLGKKHYIILHGTDCNNFPEINYGYSENTVLKWVTKKSMEWATLLLPVSESLVEANYTYQNTKYTKQGFRNFYPNIKTPYQVIYNGISDNYFYIKPDIAKLPNSFITIASGLNNERRQQVKGLDLIIELAKQTPNNTYTFIGAQKPSNIQLPHNINVIDFIPNHELIHYYNAHQFYFQLSITEGFGVSLCEAMLCGCIPIVSNVGIMPKIVGDNGYVLLKKDINLLSELVKIAIQNYNVEKGFNARNKIIKDYPVEKRKNELINIILNNSKTNS